MIQVNDGLVERLCHIQHDVMSREGHAPWEGVPEPTKITMRTSMKTVLAAINAMTNEKGECYVQSGIRGTETRATDREHE